MRQRLLLLFCILALCVLCACGHGRSDAALPKTSEAASAKVVRSSPPAAASEAHAESAAPAALSTAVPSASPVGIPLLFTPVPTPDPLTSLYSEKDFAPQPSSIPFTVTVVLSPDPAPTPTPRPTPRPDITGEEIALFAMEFLGFPYVWGEESPETGFDCSGLVFYVYDHFNFEISRVSEDMAYDGDHVEPADIQPGDILCFPRAPGSRDYYHVGIYIGGWEYIHARDSASGVVISSLDERKFGFEARRLIGAE